MNNWYYDFHLHSCLSPCGDQDMTPYNIVNMAALKELDVIALTDHNSCRNCGAAMAAGTDAGIVVLPGMELCTSEEIHVVCLFSELEQAEAFSRMVEQTLPAMENDVAIFGEQLVMDAQDHIIQKYTGFLAGASSIGIYTVPDLVRQYGGIAFPAHIDKPSFSLLSVLGEYPADLSFPCAEYTRNGNRDILQENHLPLRQTRLLQNSDAHYLQDIQEKIYILTGFQQEKTKKKTAFDEIRKEILYFLSLA